MRVPLADSTLVKLEEDLPGDIAVLIGDVLATGFYCAELAGVEPGDTVAVIGAGPVGLMATLAADDLGAGAIYVLDTVAERLELARTFGGLGIDVGRQDPLEVLRQATAGRGADRVLEAVGSPQATRTAVDLVRPGGTISAIGVHTEPTFAFAPGEAYDKNLSYRAGRCPARAYAERLLEVVERRSEVLAAVVSHRLPLAEGVDGYRLFAQRRDGCTKVVLYPS